jgi:hypothetical protein
VGLFIRLTVIVALAIVALMILSFVLVHIVLPAAIIAAIILGVIAAVGLFRRLTSGRNNTLIPR